MLKTLSLPLALVAVALCAWAAQPLAHVSSTKPFDINGAAVPVDGVPSWPVYPGDIIVTHAAPATIKFADGSYITLQPGSTLKIEFRHHQPFATILHGSGKYFVAGAAVALSATGLALTGTFDTVKPPSVSPSK